MDGFFYELGYLVSRSFFVGFVGLSPVGVEPFQIIDGELVPGEINGFSGDAAAISALVRVAAAGKTLAIRGARCGRETAGPVL